MLLPIVLAKNSLFVEIRPPPSFKEGVLKRILFLADLNLSFDTRIKYKLLHFSFQVSQTKQLHIRTHRTDRLTDYCTPLCYVWFADYVVNSKVQSANMLLIF